MSFCFQSGGKNIDVGLEIDPTDVSLRVVDRRPSFVVAMNDHIRGQINDAMMKFSRNADVPEGIAPKDDSAVPAG